MDEEIDSARRDAFKSGMLDSEGGTIDLLVSKTAQDTPITAVLRPRDRRGQGWALPLPKI